ncbi:NACHT domain-containing protein [Hamadaea sp. NPDC050747]|uniref:NACHT domain-containing protein n=1 Tax=Hamadaea sp. NPDC050747 TaxID=3155789 RepID=UPI0033C837EF
MRRVWLRTAVAVAMAAVLAGMSVWAWRRSATDGLSLLWTVVPGVLAVLAALGAWVGKIAADRDGDLARAADALATRVAAYLAASEGNSHQMLTLPVAWATTEHAESVMVGWAGVRGDPRDESPVDLSGRFADIAEVYARLPRPRRLVVLGRGGAGKTSLAARLVADLLERRQPGEPVPVLLALSSWDPQQRLQTWLADRLAEIAPALGAPAEPFDPDARRRPTVAQALVNAGLVLPVLDGFDEIAEDVRPGALSGIARAVRRRDEVVVTSRPDEFEEAVAVEGPLPGAGVVELADLEAGDVDRHLRASAGGQSAKWRTVLDELRGHPDGPLAQALSTPLMVWLAVTVYRGQDADPSELLGPELRDSREAIELHLLQGLVPAVYDRARNPRRRRWTPVKARRWLGSIAYRMTQGGGALVWSLLPGSLSHTAVAVFGAVAGGAAGYALGKALGLVIGVVTGALVGVGGDWRFGPKVVAIAGALVVAFTGAAQAGSGHVATGSGIIVLAGWLIAGVTRSFRQRRWRTLTSARTHSLIQTLVAVVPVAYAAQALDANVGGWALTAALVWLVFFTTWGEWLVARTWLAVTGRLPWSINAFLHDAHRRGVLRHEGLAYEFRHARLQDTFATTIPAQRGALSRVR